MITDKRASGSGELREEARAAKHQTAKQAHSKQPGSLKLLHLMRSCDPEKKPDFILLIPGSQGASPTHSFFRGFRPSVSLSCVQSEILLCTQLKRQRDGNLVNVEWELTVLGT